MSKKAFYDWCINHAKLRVSTTAQYEKHVDIIESVFGSLDIAYKKDRCAGIITEMEQDKAQFEKGLAAKDLFKISHLKDPVHRLYDMISALRKYVEYLDDQKPVAQKSIIQKPVKTNSIISYGNPPFPFPKVIGDIPADYVEPPYFENIFYEEEVYNDPNLVVRGLLVFLYNEIEGMIQTFCALPLIDKPLGTLYRIPIIIRRETPVEHYYPDFDLVNEAIKRRDKPSDIFKKELLDLIDRNYFERPIMGLYHSDGGRDLPEIRNNKEFKPFTNCDRFPYIEIFYRNIDSEDMDDYIASLAMTLAHEMFHFFHDQHAPLQFNKASKYRKPVIEASADFFSFFHLIKTDKKSHNSARINRAEKRYSAWKDRFGSVWPYAYALYFLIIKGSELPFSTNTDYYDSNGCLEKLSKVVILSKKGMNEAYNHLTN